MIRSRNSTKTNQNMMEFLELPTDMLWNGKLEPMSPPIADHLSLSNFDNFLLYEDDCLVNDLLLNNNQNVLIIADEELEQDGEVLIEFNLEVKHESWLDEKSNQPPPLEDLPSIGSPPDAANNFSYDGNNVNTEELLMEFEKIYDAVELTHLTPPQTPPQQHQDHLKFNDCYDIFNNLQRQQSHNQLKQFNPQQIVYQQPTNFGMVPQLDNTNIAAYYGTYQTFASQGNLSPDTSENEMSETAARDLEVVDELVRSHCKELPDLNDEQSSSDSCSSSSPPRSEISYSSSSNGRYASSVCSNDDDWSPSRKTSISAKLSTNSADKTGTPVRKRRLPGVDKKSRKKEQNKNAATRYRQKKKAEVEVILEVEKDLLTKHEKLESKYSDIRREVKYLKNLMRELFRAKGMLVD